jgi:chemotaxis protein MotB
MARKFHKKPEEGQPLWLLSYSDLVTQLLVFFVMLYAVSSDKVDTSEIRLLLSNFSGMGSMSGGNTLQTGKMADLGNSVMSLPSMEKGKFLGRAKQVATAAFQAEIRTKAVRIREDERGLVISLAADSFFEPASAAVVVDRARAPMQKLAALLSSPEMAGRKFRLEGHSDNVATDPRGPYPTNWELSALRAVNILHFLTDYGIDDQRAQTSGLADTVPLAANDTPEGRAYNRRVDVILLFEGHL